MAKIEEILKELTEFEPELKKHKKELSMIIKAMMEAKPDTKFDQTFAQNLRTKLILNSSYTKQSPSNFFFMKKLSYLLSGVVLTLVVASAGYFGVNFYKENMVSGKSVVSFVPNIVEVGDHAFGVLNNTAGGGVGGGTERGLGGAETSTNAVPKAEPEAISTEGNEGSGQLISPSDNPASVESATGLDKSISFNATSEAPGEAETTDLAITIDQGNKMVPPPDNVMYPYPITVYKYVYAGDEFTVDEPQVTVLKRVPAEKPGMDVLKLLENFDVSKLFDISKLKKAYLEYLTVSENRDFGYSLYISLTDGTVSFSQNYKKWPQTQCLERACSSPVSIKIGDIPSDSEIIKMANDFLSEYKIDLSKSYGDPIVNRYFENDYAVAMEEGWEPYIPEDISVTYPLKINGLETYYDGGDKNGATVSVNVRYDKVSSVWGLNSLTYESSKYDAIDKDMVMEVLRKGGLNNYLYYYEPQPTDAIKEVEIKLGTPAKGYMTYWNYKDGTNEEMLVEALVFPVLEKPTDEDYFYTKAIVVPLTKDVYSNPSNPIVRPL